jgi:allophanate hydrolase subunit 1
VELPVVIDGPDLAEVAGLTGRDVAALVRALTPRS